jgi:ferredoxin
VIQPIHEISGLIVGWVVPGQFRHQKDAEAIWLMQKVPVVELSECIECDCCVEICPEVFKKNESMGYIEVIELGKYPELEVQDVINFCPADCIGWEYIS